MATVKRFEDLIAWQKARILNGLVFKACKHESIKHDFRLFAQWKSSSGSVMDNIAEGFDRQGNKEFIQFLSIARGSLGECQSQTYRVLDQGDINEQEFREIYHCAQEIKNGIDKLIKYLKASDIKGYKYKKEV
jgi:four helix bundle protein